MSILWSGTLTWGLAPVCFAETATCFCEVHCSSGLVYLASSEGLFVLDPKTANFTHYTVEDGLPASLCVAVAAGPDGEIYVSTPGGVAKKDDYGWLTLDLRDALGFRFWPNAKRLVTDTGGGLWLLDFEVGYYDGDRFVLYDTGITDRGWCLTSSSDGCIWSGHIESTVIRWSDDGMHTTYQALYSDQSAIQDGAEDIDDTMWFADGDRVLHLVDPESETWEVHWPPFGGNARHLAIGPLGEKYIGCDLCIYRLNAFDWELISESISVRDMEVDTAGVLWVVGWDWLVLSWDGQCWTEWYPEMSADAVNLVIALDRDWYSWGHRMTTFVDAATEMGSVADFYVALQMPSGELLFYPSFGTEMTPFVSGIQIPANTHLKDYELFRLTLPDLPAGTYRWYAACTHAGTIVFASNIASCEWQFTE